MKFYAYYRIPIAEDEHPSNGGLSGMTNLVRIAVLALAKKKNVKSIVELHLCKDLLNGIANEFGSKVKFEDGEYCFSCAGIGIWCDDSLAQNEMEVVCR